MATVRESLIEVVKLALDAHRNGTFDSDLYGLSEILENLIEPAVTGEEDAVRYIVSLMNVLLEMRRRALPHAVFAAHLSSILKSLDRPNAPADVFMQGEEAEAETRPELRVGCTMMKWSDFCRFYAPRYGKARSRVDLEALWARVTSGNLRAPRLDLHLTSSSGAVWITDEDALYNQCGQHGVDLIDGTKAYDSLGLDWSSGWSYTKPTAEARAVLLKASVSQRRSSGRGLRVPTSVDAWGSLAFVPRQTSPPCKWPSNSGMTVDPITGEECLPEAIHGPHVVASNADCPVLPCSPVRKVLPGRVNECGRDICMKALEALRAS